MQKLTSIFNNKTSVNKIFDQNRYTVGDIVNAKENPFQNLVIRRFYKQIYYCTIQDFPDKKDLVYFERELIENKNLIQKKIKLGKV